MSYSAKSIAKWTQMISRFPRHRLGTWPTPVEPLLISGLPTGRSLWIKRDDLSSSTYGGNKVRKLEFLLAASKGPVLTIGATGSHHVLATALYARTLHRSCFGILVPQPLTPHAIDTNALIEKACSKIISFDRPIHSVLHALKAAFLFASSIASNKPITLIPPGGSSPLGNLGYVLAGLELAEQIADGQCPIPDEIYLPLGTGGTTVGLALGLALANLKTEVRAVRTASKISGNSIALNVLAARTFSLLTGEDSREIMPRLRIKIINGFIGRGYGHPTAAANDALSRVTDPPLEITYSAKAMAGMISAIVNGPTHKVRMFLDTYGPITDLPNTLLEVKTR